MVSMAGPLRQLLWSLPVVVAFTDVVASVIKVEGVSMQPTFNPPSSSSSDWVLVEKLSIKLLHRYNRGDVTVLWAPDDPHQQIIKRMVAVEGDMVLMPDGSSDVQSIPKGRCWIEGDNPPKSGDSISAYGPVHLGLLEGRVTHILWPPSRIGRVLPHVPGRVTPGPG